MKTRRWKNLVFKDKVKISNNVYCDILQIPQSEDGALVPMTNNVFGVFGAFFVKMSTNMSQ